MRIALPLLFLLVFPHIATADSKQDISPLCSEMKKQLALPGDISIKSSQGTFNDAYDNIEHQGCRLSAGGTINQYPDYYRYLMRLYPTKDNQLGREHWQPDRQSDGPDGSSFTISRGNRFCQVSGSWNDKFFNYQVECGKKIEIRRR